MNEPIINVTTPLIREAAWSIHASVSDRWGDLNEFRPADPAESAALQAVQDRLEADPDLLSRLQAQMWDEISFIAQKDGQLGVLFEIEFNSLESDGDDLERFGYRQLPTQAQCVDNLLEQIKVLQPQFPGVEFCVPDKTMIFNHRPAIWGFVRDGLLDDAKLEALATALLDYALPEPVEELEQEGMKP